MADQKRRKNEPYTKKTKYKLGTYWPILELIAILTKFCYLDQNTWEAKLFYLR